MTNLVRKFKAKRMSRYLFLILTLTLVGTSIFAKSSNIHLPKSSPTTWYVNLNDGQGSNSNTGLSYDQPFRTFELAFINAKAGDIVMLQGNGYWDQAWEVTESVTITTADKDFNGNPISERHHMSKMTASNDKNHSVLVVKPGVTLILENIEIDGGGN